MQPVITQSTRAVIFDLDGTLYSQPRLRRMMMLKLLCYAVLHPLHIRDLRVLALFRSLRETHAGEVVPSLEEQQYVWVAHKTGISSESARGIVEHWMYTEPLFYLPRCKPRALDTALARLRSAHIKIGIFSDYPVEEKLAALNVSADAYAYATQPVVNALKPHPRSLEVVLELLGVAPDACVVVGNRKSRDGLAAQRAGIRYAHVHDPEQFFTALASEEMKVS